MNWQTQTAEKPLFADLIWSRPERKDQAGKLLIVGGSTHGFANVIKAMEAAKSAGIGEVRAILPKGLEKHLPSTPDFLYVPQTSTGSLAQNALEDSVGALKWANALLLPGDLSHNAETTILIEKLLHETDVPAVVCGEALDVLQSTLSQPLKADIVAIADFKQLQAMVKQQPLVHALLSTSTLEQQVTLLQHLITKTHLSSLVLHNEGHCLVVGREQASLTKSDQEILEYSAKAAVLAAQFPAKLFEATTTAAII